MDRHSDKVKILILGSSYAAYGINPAFLADSAFNLALSGQSVKYNLMLLRKYIDKMPHLNKAILGIGYQTPFFMDYENYDIFTENTNPPSDFYISYSYLPYFLPPH